MSRVKTSQMDLYLYMFTSLLVSHKAEICQYLYNTRRPYSIIQKVILLIIYKNLRKRDFLRISLLIHNEITFGAGVKGTRVTLKPSPTFTTGKRTDVTVM